VVSIRKQKQLKGKPSTTQIAGAVSNGFSALNGI